MGRRSEAVTETWWSTEEGCIFRGQKEWVLHRVTRWHPCTCIHLSHLVPPHVVSSFTADHIWRKVWGHLPSCMPSSLFAHCYTVCLFCAPCPAAVFSTLLAVGLTQVTQDNDYSLGQVFLVTASEGNTWPPKENPSWPLFGQTRLGSLSVKWPVCFATLCLSPSPALNGAREEALTG